MAESHEAVEPDLLLGETFDFVSEEKWRQLKRNTINKNF